MPFQSYSVISRLSQLHEEITRFKKAQDMMANVNAALKRGDTYVLQQFKLPKKLITELKQRHARGLPAYPNYVFKHNTEYLDVLQSELTELEGQQKC
jgi:hypothetical protein